MLFDTRNVPKDPTAELNTLVRARLTATQTQQIIALIQSNPLHVVAFLAQVLGWQKFLNALWTVQDAGVVYRDHDKEDPTERR